MKIHDVIRLTAEKWLNLFAATFEHNGHVGRWVFASRQAEPHRGDKPADAVLIIPVLVEEEQPRRLVLLREYRVPVGDYLYAFPAGLLEPGEEVQEAVRRELREETGLEVLRITRVTQPLYSTAGLTDEAVAQVFVEVHATPGGRADPEASEDFEVVLLDFEGVCHLCDDINAKIDGKAWNVLHLYQQLGRIV